MDARCWRRFAHLLGLLNRNRPRDTAPGRRRDTAHRFHRAPDRRAASRVQPRWSLRPTAGSSSASRAAGCASSRTARCWPTPFVTLTVSASRRARPARRRLRSGLRDQPFVYVYYTATTPTVHNRISRFTANGDVAVAGSEVVHPRARQPQRRDEPQRRRDPLRPGRQALRRRWARTPTARTRSAVATCSARCCASTRTARIPSRQPVLRHGDRHATAPSGRSACATRSRSRSSPAAAAMFINDVGQNTWEEINDGVAGANYGWPTDRGRDRRSAASVARATRYDHGGRRLRHHRRRVLQPGDGAVPGRLRRRLLLRRLLRRLDPAARSQQPATPSPASRPASPSPVDLKVGRRRQPLLPRARRRGDRRRLPRQTTAASAPAITHAAGQPHGRRRARPATFSVAASGAAPLELPVAAQRRQHRRRHRRRLHASPSVVQADNGARFRVRGHQRPRHRHQHRGRADRDQRTRRRRRPSPQPAAGTLYSGGRRPSASRARARDPEDGTLPASAFTWQVDFHHDTHIHPFVPPTSGATERARSRFRPRGETAANVWYRIHLTVRDSAG